MIVYRVDLYLIRFASEASSGWMFSSKYLLSWVVQLSDCGRISATANSFDSAVLGLAEWATGTVFDPTQFVAEASLDRASALSFSSRGIWVILYPLNFLSSLFAISN